MSDMNLVSIAPAKSHVNPKGAKRGILLLKPPYFTPWTPPLGIAILKTFLEKHGYSVTCFDFNTDPELWGMHHKYFATIQRLEDVSINDGYSKLWWILNAHLLAYANGADASAIERVLEIIIPLYGIRHDDKVIDALIPIVDRYFHRLSEVSSQIDLSQYGVVGTSTYTTSLASSLFLLKRMKAKDRRLLTVMGGGIFADDLALGSDNLETLINECHYIDHVILGEGELLFLKLLEGELSHKRVITISDLQGKTLDMKDVPAPDFSDLNLENYYHLSIEGARSCPFQCSFCSETIQWGDYRKKPMDVLAEQVVELSQKFNIKEFFMGDSLMNPYINPFALELIERKAGVLYDGYLRADKPVTNRKFVKMWTDSGLFRVRLGIESAATNVLNVMDKMTTPQVISNVLKTLASAGVRTTTYWIVGFPGETEEDFQQTCNFIKEHHQYIYELEAHPYYYYPYGQVGSRLYQCRSLYPPEVTNHTKFKVWEIIDADPPREVRYERLRRLAKMCADLGLVNIYTMAQRYQAEDRWHRLHPLAIEVYESGRVDRKPETLSGVTIECSADAAMVGSEDPVICYQASVAKQLNRETLAAALRELINYNDTLQLTLRDEKYVVDHEAEEFDPNKLVSVYQVEEWDQESRTQAKTRAVAELAEEMRPAWTDSIRAALITGKEPCVDLLLLVHRGLADAKSVSLLFEDLFRIYEQLSNQRKISLRPIPKTYTSHAVNCVGGGDLPAVAVDQATDIESDIKTTMISIDHHRMDRMFSKTLKDEGVQATDVFVEAIVATLSQVTRTQDMDLDLRSDSRPLDEDLRYTPGPLTRTSFLTQLSAINTGSQRRERILLNFEFCCEKPWLGQDQWKPGGFWSDGGPLAPAYQLEITPVEAGNGLQVHLKYRNCVDTMVLVKDLSRQLVEQIDSILYRHERHAAAREYWNEEFTTSLPRSSSFTQTDGNISRLGNSSFSCALDRMTLGKLSADCRIDLSTIILAVYSIVLSRLNGSEEIIVVACPSQNNGTGFVPLRTALPWTLSFREFALQIERKLGLASQNSAHVFNIFNGGPRPVFDAAYIFNDESEVDEYSNGHQPAELPAALDAELKLILKVTIDWSGLTWHFNHAESCLTPDVIERLNSSLSSILARVAKDVNMPLADAILDSDEKLLFESVLSIEELESSFSF